MGGGGTTQTTQQSGLSNPEMNAAASTIGNQLNTQLQAGVSPYTGSLVPGLSAQTTQGINSVMGAAGNSGGLYNAYDWANGIVGGGGLNAGQRGNVGTVNGVGGEFGGIANSLAGASAAQSGFTSMYQNAGGPSLTEGELMGVARGDHFGVNAPGYARLRQNAIDDAMSATSGLFTTNGRFGSGSHLGAAGEGVADALAGMDYQNYQNDIARQERALGAIEGQRQQGFQNQFSSLGAADQARLAQLSGRMGALGAQQGAAQSAFGMGQQGFANEAAAAAAVPSLYSATLMPGQAQLQVGQTMDAYNTAKAQDDARIFDATQNAGWNTLQRGGSIFSGTAPVSGTTQTNTQPAAPWWQGLFGAALGAF